MVVGGVGSRDGKSGILISVWGGGNWLLNTGSNVVRLLRVVRRLPEAGMAVGEVSRFSFEVTALERARFRGAGAEVRVCPSE